MMMTTVCFPDHIEWLEDLFHSVRIGNVQKLKFQIHKYVAKMVREMKVDVSEYEEKMAYYQRNLLITFTDENRNTALHVAVTQNRLEVFKELVKRCRVNAFNSSQESPIHLAAANNLTEFVTLLIENNANVNQQNRFGETPLHLSIIKNNWIMADILLHHNADIFIENWQKETPLDLIMKTDEVENLEFLLSRGLKLYALDNNKRTLLHIAAEYGSLKIVQFLITNGITAIDFPDCQNITPLFLAVEKGYSKVVECLIENGSTMMYVDNRDSKSGCFVSKNLLHVSLSKGHLDVWNSLVKCNSKIDANRCTELHSAVRAGEVETVKKILDHQTQNEGHSIDSRLAVYIAVEMGNETILEILLKAGCSTRSCFNDRTPLHVAATFEQTRLVDMLLSAGANIDSKTTDNYTPLVFAIAAGQPRVVKFLLEAGADPTILYNKVSPLIYVVRRGSRNADLWTVTPVMFQNLLKITEMLVVAGKYECDEDLLEELISCAMKIRVNNELCDLLNSTLESTGIVKKCNSEIEFRSEIVRYFLNYLKFDWDLNCFSKIRNSSLLDIALEYNDYRLGSNRLDPTCDDKKCNLLVVAHTKNSSDFKYYLLHLQRSGLLYQNIDTLKIILARQVMIFDDSDTSKSVLTFLERHNFVDLRKDCEVQLKLMKETEIVDDFKVTFFDILTKSVDSVAKFIRKEKVLETLESSYVKLPAYAELLKLSVEKGKKRMDLIDSCTNLMIDVIEKNYDIQFAEHHAGQILQYLSVKDMTRFLEARNETVNLNVKKQYFSIFP